MGSYDLSGIVNEENPNKEIKLHGNKKDDLDNLT